MHVGFKNIIQIVIVQFSYEIQLGGALSESSLTIVLPNLTFRVRKHIGERGIDIVFLLYIMDFMQLIGTILKSDTFTVATS